MLYLLISNGAVVHATTDHRLAERQFADAAKAADDKTAVELLQFQADPMATKPIKALPKAVDVSKLSPEQQQQLLALLNSFAAQKGGA